MVDNPHRKHNKVNHIASEAPMIFSSLDICGIRKLHTSKEDVFACQQHN